MTGRPSGGAGPSLAVRRGAGTAERAFPARRLTLTAGEWAVLVEDRRPDLPPGFGAVPLSDRERDDAMASLRERDVLAPGRGGPAEPAPAVAVQLGVLRRPVLSVRLDVTGRGGGREAWFAVASGLVAGVVALAGGLVELSLAADARLGAELVRAVPDASSVVGPGFPEEPAATGAAPSGRLPLALLDDASSGPGTGFEPSAAETALADELQRRSAGSLSCLVLGRIGDVVGTAQVSWLATDAGWVGVRAIADGSPRRLIDVVPVQPADLGSWVVPAVAAVLEASDELT